MLARFAIQRPGAALFGLVGLLVLVAAAPHRAAADDPPEEGSPAASAPPASEPSPRARPVESLAGKLVRVRPKKDRSDAADVLNTIDLARDVVYTTTESPVPESEQFQFIDGILRTPEKGDARLCLPVTVPALYRLSLDLVRKDEAADPAIGIGATLDGHPFFIEMRMATLTLSRFYDQEITKPLAPRNQQFHAEGPEGVAELIVGDSAILAKHRFQFLEWLTAGSTLSLDEKWALPGTDNIFLTFPDGQFDVRSLKLEPLTREQWVEQITKLMPEGQIAAAAAGAAAANVGADVKPLPELDALRSTILMRARQGDFDELERWAARLRKEQPVVDDKFVAENFYYWLATEYVSPVPSGTYGKLEGSYQAQFAFVDAWLKQKPDSVAARIAKGHAYIAYAWDIRGGGFAHEVPPESWEPFHDRLQTAEETLNEAARLKPRDVCVFSTLAQVGKALGWSHKKMERTIERGLQVSKKDFVLIDGMVINLLPRWGGAPGDLGKFALRMSERIKGDDGLYVYIRVARTTQSAEVDLKRISDEPEQFGQSHRDFTDPKVVLEEFSADKLRAAAAVLQKRHPTAKRSMNYVCWVYCVLDDPAAAKEQFAKIVDKPDLAIWGSRDLFDHWRHWCDPSVAEPSQYLPVEGEEIARLQAYSDGAAKINFQPDGRTLITGNTAPSSAIKFWDFGEQKIARQFEPPRGVRNLIDLWMLDRGELFALVSDGDKTTIVEYPPPDYARRGLYPANFFGNPFSMISDDGSTAALFTKDNVSIANARLKTSKDFAVPAIVTADFSPDGKYFLGVGDKIHVWDSMAGKELTTIDVQPKLSRFMRDGNSIVYTTDDQLVVWDVVGNRQRFSIPLNPQHVVQAVRSNPDGRFLAAAERRAGGDDGNERHVVAIYDLNAPEPVHVFDGHKTSILELAISLDGTLLASSSTDGVVKVWDLGAKVPAALPIQPAQASQGSQSSAGISTATRSIAIIVCLAILVSGWVIYRRRQRH
ncbi:MAG TPA: DUF4034 domain-containing protein [Pirellulales bacterium]|nr:DUF4034 domain-containing protein [Pirellulales bacterium]